MNHAPKGLCSYLSFILFPVILLLFSCFNSTGQPKRDTKISADMIEILKQRKLVFILPEPEYKNMDKYVKLIPGAWKLTPVEVVKYSDMSKFWEQADQYAFLTIGGLESTTYMNRSMSSSYSDAHFFLNLSLPVILEKKRGTKVKSTELCRVELYPDNHTVIYGFTKKDFYEGVYTQAKFHNFTLPYILSYLRFVQKNIESNKNPSVYNNYEDPQLLQKLRKDTLYIPDSLLSERNRMTGKDLLKDQSFFKAYPGPYRILSNEELTAIIENRDHGKPVFLFEYIISSTDKYVSVLEVNSGTVVYRKYTPISYSLKEKDLEKIGN